MTNAERQRSLDARRIEVEIISRKDGNKMIDCNITENYLREKARMTKDCEIPCGACQISCCNNEENCTCEYFSEKFPQKAIAIVQKWSNEHPQRTYLSDFLEKYPNATIEKDGTPPVCAQHLGYISQSIEGVCRHDWQGACSDCWNTPMKEDTPCHANHS